MNDQILIQKRPAATVSLRSADDNRSLDKNKNNENSNGESAVIQSLSNS